MSEMLFYRENFHLREEVEFTRVKPLSLLVSDGRQLWGEYGL